MSTHNICFHGVIRKDIYQNIPLPRARKIWCLTWKKDPLFKPKRMNINHISLQKWGTSNEYSQHRFSWRNKKKIFIGITLLPRTEVVEMIIQQNRWKCPYPLPPTTPPPPPPPPPKNTIFQKLVSWSELFIFLKNHQNHWIQLIRWKFSPLT